MVRIMLLGIYITGYLVFIRIIAQWCVEEDGETKPYQAGPAITFALAVSLGWPIVLIGWGIYGVVSHKQTSMIINRIFFGKKFVNDNPKSFGSKQ